MTHDPTPGAVGRSPGDLHERERVILARILARKPATHDVNARFAARLKFGDRLADKVAAFGGSWTFIMLFGGLLVAWAALNSLILITGAFDPYPYIFLNLLLSMIAALQAPVIMMSQNRHAAKDRLAAEHDYDVNLKAEIEIMQLHDKLDEIRTTQLAQLLTTQQEQLSLLTRLVQQQSLEGRGRS